MIAINLKLLETALNSLRRYEQKRSTDGSEGKLLLIENGPAPILVELTLNNKIEGGQTPVKLSLPHSLFFPESSDVGLDHSVCLFVKSDEKQKIQETLALNPIDGLTKIITLNQVLKQYKEFKNRKQLLKEHSHFLCDARIRQHLYSGLGNVFSKSNDLPIPVDLSSNIINNISTVLKSTYMMKKGKNISIRLGYLCMTNHQLIENVLEGIKNAVDKLKEKWDSIAAIHIRTIYSPSFPLYGKHADEAISFVNQHSNNDDKIVEEKKSVIMIEEDKVDNALKIKKRKKDVKSDEDNSHDNEVKQKKKKKVDK